MGKSLRLAPKHDKRVLPGVDWNHAKAAFIAGKTAQAIADDLKVSVLTVRKRAHRESWGKLRLGTRLEIRKAEGSSIGEWLRDRGEQWLGHVDKLMFRTTEAANRMAGPRTRSDLKMDAEIVHKLVDAGRKAYGLDQQNIASAVQIAVYNKQGVVRIDTQSPRMDYENTQPLVTTMPAIDTESIGLEGEASNEGSLLPEPGSESTGDPPLTGPSD